jgi:hypothetical protein
MPYTIDTKMSFPPPIHNLPGEASILQAPSLFIRLRTWEGVYLGRIGKYEDEIVGSHGESRP